MRLLGFILIIFLFQTQAHAAYNRFWIGFKKDELSAVDFMNGLNQIFFAKTINLGASKGLIAYQPYITMMNSDLPDEIALVTYQDEASYKAIKATKEGEEYSAAHWDYFDKAKSKSAVPLRYAGNIKADVAYELNPEFSDWQANETYVTLYEAPTDLGSLEIEVYLLKNYPDINNTIFMIKGNVLIEYRSVRAGTDVPANFALKVLEHRKLVNRSLNGSAAVDFGDGVNFQWLTELF